MITEVKESDCCHRNVPKLSGYRQDGDRFTCSTCGKEWEWIEDEAEGGFWDEVI